MSSRHAELKRLADAFTATFNAHDLEATMAYFTDDAVYEEMHGPVREGKTAIRKAFEALFSKQFGAMRFDAEDTFVDAEAGKVMTSWTLNLSALEGKPVALRGLDLLHFEGDKLVRKLTYCKAKVPRYVDA
ncbi:MAG: nuclear transport factor 2 family protein [Gammaproteobacteria bacterium]|nr:nuclear transport factor 2 family protein [Gammaproteobacteria bacterium]